jgi:hypothetical protein
MAGPMAILLWVVLALLGLPLILIAVLVLLTLRSRRESGAGPCRRVGHASARATQGHRLAGQGEARREDGFPARGKPPCHPPAQRGPAEEEVLT